MWIAPAGESTASIAKRARDWANATGRDADEDAVRMIEEHIVSMT